MATLFALLNRKIVVLVVLVLAACAPVTPYQDEIAPTTVNETEPAVDEVEPAVGAPKFIYSRFTFNQRCLEPEAGGIDFQLSGTLVTVNMGYFFISLPAWDKPEPLPDGLRPLYVSPDNANLMLLDYEDYFSYSSLIIQNSQKEIIRTFEWQEDWKFPERWINAEQVWVSTTQPGKYELLDINTGEISSILFPYIDEVRMKESFADIRSEVVLFDPTLTNVMYEGNLHVFILRGGRYFLYDNPEPVLWARKNRHNWTKPVWSHAGDKIAVPLSSGRIDDLYILNAYGDEIRATDFFRMYDSPSSTLILNLSWSPDGRYIALQLNLRTKEDEEMGRKDRLSEGRLLVVDLENRLVTDYCLLFGYPPVWSPDGKYLFVDNTMLDVLRNEAFIFEIGPVIGWLK
jgi:WD40 repeat protein